MIVDLNAALRVLSASARASDRRKARDLAHLRDTTRGLWRGRVSLVDSAYWREGTLFVVFELAVRGLILCGGEIRENRRFLGVVIIPERYPLAQPSLRFVEPLPISPHVVNSAHSVPNRDDLPAVLRAFVELGDGLACWAREAQWSASSDHTLAEALWQAARLVTLNAVNFAEPPLNPAALELARRMRDEHRLPLEECLPYPVVPGAAPAMPASDEDIEWISEVGR